jgi:F-type H+-transporting ATPase subunit alpha
MKNFNQLLEQTNEIGFVEQILESLVYVQGLPQAHPGELIVFESGQFGTVLSLNEASVEVLILSTEKLEVGTRAARTNTSMKMKVDKTLIGKTLFLSEIEKDLLSFSGEEKDTREIDFTASHFTEREKVVKPLETGVSIIDLLVPLGKGQRELVIGDRKTGKTSLLLQTLRTQVQQGTICIYAAIAQPQNEVQKIYHFFQTEKLADKAIVIASHAADSPGLIFYTPYVAMTIAEYFRDQGQDVLLILDSLTTHAKYYREVMLLAKRFPGRSSYPGDIFHIHSRLLERGGSFKTGTITCFPVAQSVGGDLTGYIQSNLMSMTDGHLFFDSDLFDQGRRPAINPFLSVTRVGEQTQSPLLRNVSRELRSFLTNYEKVKQFKHFQTELGEGIQSTFDRGSRLTVMMDQLSDVIVPVPVDMVLCAALWADFWKNVPDEDMKREMGKFRHNFKQSTALQEQVQKIVDQAQTFDQLVQLIKDNDQVILDNMREKETATAPS